MTVTLGTKASMFYDPSSRLKVLPGQEVELTAEQENSKRVKNAIDAGHLRVVTGEAKEKEVGNVPAPGIDTAEGLKLLMEKFGEIMETSANNNATDEAMQESLTKAFNKAQLEKICLEIGIGPEDSDTKATLAAAIIEEQQ